MDYKKLVQNFRAAIDKAKANGEFKDDISFHKSMFFSECKLTEKNPLTASSPIKI